LKFLLNALLGVYATTHLNLTSTLHLFRKMTIIYSLHTFKHLKLTLKVISNSSIVVSSIYF